MRSNGVEALGPGLRALALAVMRQAVEDAQMDSRRLKAQSEDPSRRSQDRLEALRLLAWHEDAEDFLGSKGSDLWLRVLGVEPKVFRKRWNSVCL